MQLFSEEVQDREELRKKLKNNKNIADDYEIAVIVYAFDNDNNIIFQRRGEACRDERFKLETIGGRVKNEDANFRAALQREIKEEVGEEAEITLEEFIIATYAETFDERYAKKQKWIYLVYKGHFEKGELQVAEPTKNLGYERYQIGEVPVNQLSKGAQELYTIVKEKYS